MRHEQLTTAVTGLYEKEKGRAGQDRLTSMDTTAGISVSAPTVGAIMRQQGLRAVRMAHVEEDHSAGPAGQDTTNSAYQQAHARRGRHPRLYC